MIYAENSEQFVDPDSFNRVVKMAVDTDEVASIQEGYNLFRTYRICVVVGPELADSAPLQASLLTIVNTARRAMLGGVVVVGDLDVPVLTAMGNGQRLGQIVRKLGGEIQREIPDEIPLLLLGDPKVEIGPDHISLQVTFDGWKGGVIPYCECRRLSDRGTTLAAIIAGAIGVSELFQNLRGNPMSGQRSVGLSLWNPEFIDWEAAPAGPSSFVLPSRIWLIGLGHLGQAYLWVLGFLPFEFPGELELVLQDFDHITLANDSTSLLTNPKLVGNLKTRAMARWAERQGFRTRIVERKFPGGISISNDEPRIALGGVDNLQARAALEDSGFDCVVDAGLGGGPTEYLSIRMHCFPGATTARRLWGGISSPHNSKNATARGYSKLLDKGTDACGIVQLASRTVGAPFVGAVAAAIAISEILRRLNDGLIVDMFDMTLRDPKTRSTVLSLGQDQRFNPGFTSLTPHRFQQTLSK
ncbi:MAG: thiamine biosynthesis protein ThiF [Planctomycetota bacterium]